MYQNYNTNQILIFDGYLKARKAMLTRIIIETNTIPDQFDIIAIYLIMKKIAWCIDPNGIQNKYIVKHMYWLVSEFVKSSL